MQSNSEAEAIQEGRGPGPGPEFARLPAERERAEVPETLPMRIPSAGGAQPPGGAAGPKVPGVYQRQARRPRPACSDPQFKNGCATQDALTPKRVDLALKR